MQDLYSLVRKNSYYVLIGKLVMPVIGFLATMYIIRKLSVRDYGIYNVLLGVMGYTGLFSSLGLPSVFRRYIPEFYARKEIAALKQLVAKGLLWRLVLASTIILIIFLFSDQIANLVNIKQFSDYFIVLSLGILFYLEAHLLGAALTSLFLQKYFIISQVVYTLFRAGILYYLLQSGRGLVGLLLAEVLGFGLLLLMQGFQYRIFSKANASRGKTVFPMRRLLRFGGFHYFDEMGSEVLKTSTDVFVISAFLGPAAAGLYTFADRIVRRLSDLMPSSLFREVIMPAFFTQYSSRGEEVLGRMFNLTLKFTFFLLFPLLLGILVLGDKLIIYVFDPKYLDAVKILWIFAFFSVISSFSFPLGLVVQATERVEINLYSKIFAVYNLVFDIIVVKHYGIVGVALVTGTAVLFKNLLIFWFVRRHVQFSIDWESLARIGVNSLLMASVIFTVRPLITNIYSFFIVSLLGVIFYLLVASLNNSFNAEEKAMVNKILPKPVFVF